MFSRLTCFYDGEDANVERCVYRATWTRSMKKRHSSWLSHSPLPWASNITCGICHFYRLCSQHNNIDVEPVLTAECWRILTDNVRVQPDYCPCAVDLIDSCGNIFSTVEWTPPILARRDGGNTRSDLGGLGSDTLSSETFVGKVSSLTKTTFYIYISSFSLSCWVLSFCVVE